jgi:oligopeptide/dipeptide ABC transporter ATP-binding protein
VLYAGRVVERGATAEVFHSPEHPYTTALFQAIPEPRRGERTLLQAIPGAPPVLNTAIDGCSFAPRCPDRFDRCDEDPMLIESSGRASACWLASERPHTDD